MKPIPLRSVTLGVALVLSALAPSAHALSFVFNDTSSNGGMTTVQRNAFQTAADYWSRTLTDPVTVYIDIAFSPLGPQILGGSTANFTTASYASIRSHLISDARSALDAVAVAHLQAGPALTFLATQGDLSSRLDHDGSTNNTLIGLTTANAKAMGIDPGTSALTPDANLTFATGYAGDFVYTRAGGTPSNKIDFITVAEHEIGHALGFSSGIDDIDSCAGPNNTCGLPNTVDRFEHDWWYQPLDLFRYSGVGTADVRVGGNPYFSVDGGSTALERFSTGVVHGNAYQASHFGTQNLNLMRPYIGRGESYDATATDLAAYDAIGWNVAAVPEPQTCALLLAGLGVVGFATRRRAAVGRASQAPGKFKSNAS